MYRNLHPLLSMWSAGDRRSNARIWSQVGCGALVLLTAGCGFHRRTVQLDANPAARGFVAVEGGDAAHASTDDAEWFAREDAVQAVAVSETPEEPAGLMRYLPGRRLFGGSAQPIPLPRTDADAPPAYFDSPTGPAEEF